LFVTGRTQVRNARSSPTAVGDTMIGAAVARETVNSIAGHPARDTPFAAALIALAMTVYTFRAGIKRLLHAVRPSLRHLVAAAHRVRAVMRRWGISPSNIQVSPGANARAVGEDRARTEARSLRAKRSRLVGAPVRPRDFPNGTEAAIRWPAPPASAPAAQTPASLRRWGRAT
jgi:hypothetical protein